MEASSFSQAPTLLRAHSALLHWSSRLDVLLCGPLPVSNRSLIVEEMFNNLITILQEHAPSQRQLPRRRQPVWWTSECFVACVARNGAWRDLRRTQDPRDRSRFCAARTHFQRIVRSCQNSIWSHWQDRVSNLPRVNPRAAAREVRHTFRQGQSRDQTHCVGWPEGQDPLEQWRQHFMSVGPQSSSSFDPSFHADVMRRFADFCALLPVPGVFDSPFTTSKLRCALSRCVESAVGLDGLPHSLFKVMFPWWQSALVKLFNLVLAWGAVPSLWNHSIVVSIFKQGDPSRPRNFRPVSRESCCLKVLEHLIHACTAPFINRQLSQS